MSGFLWSCCLLSLFLSLCLGQPANTEPQCGPTTFTALSGVIKSPNYPRSYPNGLNCVYVISVAPKHFFIKLDFIELNLQAGRDFVEIRDGGSEVSPTLGRFSHERLPITLYTSGNLMWINLVTDDSVARSGFFATYTVMCGGMRRTANGSIQSPHFPNEYPNNQRCFFAITVPVGLRVTLTFTAFSTENLHDYVEVRDGGSEASPLLGKFSGSSLPPTLRSTGNQMWITFVSDHSVTRRGFRATYTSGP